MTAVSQSIEGRVQTQLKRPLIPGAIVTGADYRALGILRSLGRHGIPVWVIKSGEHSLATHSRYAIRTVAAPQGNEETRLNFYLNLSKKHGLESWVIFPTDDEAVALISRYHHEFSTAYNVVTPAWDALQHSVNKILLHRLANELNVAQPWTMAPSGRAELFNLDCTYPVILKPAIRKVSNSLVDAKAWRVDNREELLAAYDKAVDLMAPDLLMIQELIPGGGDSQFSFTALCRDGEILAYLTARRTRQFPMDFGRASTYVETIDEPALIEPSVRLLQKLHLDGLVEIEYKFDSRDEQYKLLDINPRVWGWHSLCQSAGVDYPYLLWLLANEMPLPKTTPKADVRWVRLTSDLPNAAREILSGRLSPINYIHSLFGARLNEAIFASDDLTPSVVELPLLVKLVVSRFLSRRAI